MTDIFCSYKSDDRERVRPVRDAFAAQGFDIFWDQEVPAGEDWDIWIRRYLTRSKCAIVFWSAASVGSRNVRHEATVAMEQGKLVPVLLEPLTSGQFPMGLYTQQAVNLARWTGDFGDPEWAKLRREVEMRLTPKWVKRAIHDLEAELVAERTRRKEAEGRASVFQSQVVKEAQAQTAFKREKKSVQDEAAILMARLDKERKARSELEARIENMQQRLIVLEELRVVLKRMAEDERRQRLTLEEQIEYVKARGWIFPSK